MFRILHTSDIHLGVETGTANFSRIREHAAFFDWLLETIAVEKIDGFVISGDVYDTSNAPLDAQHMFFEFLARLGNMDKKIGVVVTGGNHDGPARLSLPGRLARHIRIVGDLPRNAGAVDLDRLIVPLEAGDAPRVVCLAFPFLRAGDLPTDAAEAAMAALWRKAADRASELYPAARLIGTAHLFAAGGDLSDTERPALVGGSESVSIASFPAELAYLALGHLHRPQQVRGPILARYAGSVLPMSSAERHYKHSVVVVDIPDEGDATARTIEIPRRVPFLRIPNTGEPEDLAATLTALRALKIEPAAAGFAPFVEVMVRLDEPVADLGARVRDALAGKPVRLLRINAVTANDANSIAEAAAAGVTVDDMTPERIFKQIYADRFGAEPTEGMQKAFDRVLADVKTAGVTP
jgi:exonuclease SbcD